MNNWSWGIKQKKKRENRHDSTTNWFEMKWNPQTNTTIKQSNTTQQTTKHKQKIKHNSANNQTQTNAQTRAINQTIKLKPQTQTIKSAQPWKFTEQGANFWWWALTWTQQMVKTNKLWIFVDNIACNFVFDCTFAFTFHSRSPLEPFHRKWKNIRNVWLVWSDQCTLYKRKHKPNKTKTWGQQHKNRRRQLSKHANIDVSSHNSLSSNINCLIVDEADSFTFKQGLLVLFSIHNIHSENCRLEIGVVWLIHNTNKRKVTLRSFEAKKKSETDQFHCGSFCCWRVTSFGCVQQTNWTVFVKNQHIMDPNQSRALESKFCDIDIEQWTKKIFNTTSTLQFETNLRPIWAINWSVFVSIAPTAVNCWLRFQQTFVAFFSPIHSISQQLESKKTTMIKFGDQK